MKNKLLLAVLAAIIMLISQPAYAQEKATVSSTDTQNSNLKQIGLDSRVKILSNFLKQYDSPLAPYSADFVQMADKYNLDWKLVAAISGVESTFGKEIPPYSYNAWGWGVYGDNVIRFKSWDDGISTISQGLRERYMNQWGGEDIYQIGAMYASSSAWPGHVEYYLNQIQDFALRNPQDALSISM
jgi:Ca2+-binding RTX toxin-like protein